MDSLLITHNRETRWIRYTARAVALVWAGWWTFFGLASGLGEGLDVTGVLVHTAMPGLIFLISVIIAWRWEAIGGMVLILEGVAVLIVYPLLTYNRFPLSTVTFVLITMALPPVLAGVMVLAS